MKKLLFIFLLISAILPVSAQQNKIDSLKSILNATTDNTKRIRVLEQLTTHANPADVLIKYGTQGLELSKKLNNLKEQEDFLAAISIGYFKLYDYPKYLETCFEELDICRQLNDLKTESRVLNGIALGYGAAGENRKAINYGLTGLHIAEQNKDKDQMARLGDNISGYYLSLKLMDSALYYAQSCYHIAIEIHDPLISYPLMQLATIEDSLHHFNRALAYFNQAIPFILKDDGYAHRNLMDTYFGIGNIYKEKGNVDSAFHYADKAYQLARRDNDLNGKLETATLLSTLYEGRDYKQSLFYYKIAVAMKDTIYGADKEKQFQALEVKEKAKQQELIEQRQKEIEERKENLQLSGIALFIPMFLLSALLLSRTKTHKRVIEFMSVLSLLLVFEFVTLLLHPYIEKITSHTPVLEYLILVAMAAVLVPLHHNLTHWLKEKLVHVHQLKAENEKQKTE